MKSVASAGNLSLVCSELSCCQRGTDPRALVGKSDVPSTTSLPCPQTSPGTAYTCRDLGVPAFPYTLSLPALGCHGGAGLGSPRFRFLFCGLVLGI